VREGLGDRELPLVGQDGLGDQAVGEFGDAGGLARIARRMVSSRRSLLRTIASIRPAASPNGRPWPG
jgi:hypothetical protein